jgi:hypothetical protein
MWAIINLFLAILLAVIAVGQWEEGRFRYMAVSLVLCVANFWSYASSINS